MLEYLIFRDNQFIKVVAIVPNPIKPIMIGQSKYHRQYIIHKKSRRNIPGCPGVLVVSGLIQIIKIAYPIKYNIVKMINARKTLVCIMRLIKSKFIKNDKIRHIIKLYFCHLSITKKVVVSTSRLNLRHGQLQL